MVGRQGPSGAEAIEDFDDQRALRNLMENAKRLGEDEVWWRALRRLCELEGLNFDAPLNREFHAMLAAYEELLSAKNGRRTAASRTRQKLKNKGVIQSLEDWALSRQPTQGFELLIANGMPELTAEYMVVRHPDRFSEAAVMSAKVRLREKGVDV